MSDSIQRTSVGDFPISQTVTVPASASLIFVSGTLPDLVDPTVPGVFGNTEVQTVSVFNKLRQTCASKTWTWAISCSYGYSWSAPRKRAASWISPGCSVGIRSSSAPPSSRTSPHAPRCRSWRCHCPVHWWKSKPSPPGRRDNPSQVTPLQPPHNRFRASA